MSYGPGNTLSGTAGLYSTYTKCWGWNCSSSHSANIWPCHSVNNLHCWH